MEEILKEGNVYEALMDMGSDDVVFHTGMYYMSFKDGTLRFNGKDREINTDYWLVRKCSRDEWCMHPELCTFLDYRELINYIIDKLSEKSFLNSDAGIREFLKVCEDKDAHTFIYNAYCFGRKEIIEYVKDILISNTKSR